MDENESHTFSINQRESHVKSDIDTISLRIYSRDTRKLKFLIDTGAEISIIRSTISIISCTRDLTLKKFLKPS